MKGSLAMPYFRASAPALSSAMKRFTVLFEMGRSGTTSLLSPSNSVEIVCSSSQSLVLGLTICNICYRVFLSFTFFDFLGEHALSLYSVFVDCDT
jgi:hypothetical protein